MKKFVSVVLTLALLITLLPPFSSSQIATAATGSFIFPTETDQSTKARITTEPRLTLTGTLNGVDPSSVAYSVYQITNNKGTDDPQDDVIGSQKENITSSIVVTGFNIQVFNLELFPGLNRITFRGVQGGGEVSNSIYIEYHNGPVFYDLVAQLDGLKYNIEEAGTTVVHSPSSAGRASADISITGFAPNAQQVTIEVNGSSKTYQVSSSNNYQFAASPITLNKGKNQVTLKVQNANQTVESKRELAFYNGEVTFYDLNLTGGVGSASEALEYQPNLLLATTAEAKVVGKIIVPNYLNDDNNDGVLDPHPNPNAAGGIPVTYRIDSSVGTFTTTATPVGTYTGQESYFIYEFTAPIGSHTLAFEKRYNIQFTAKNARKVAQGQPGDEGTGQLGFTLQDVNKQFIDRINYLSGYRSGTGESLTGTALEGASIYGVPFAMEVLVGNVNTSQVANLLQVADIKNVSGASAPASYDKTNVANIENVSSSLVNKFVTVDGKVYKREILIFKRLPFEGTQTVTLRIGAEGESGATKQVKFTMLFGPYVNYTSAYDNMRIYDDTNKTRSERRGSTIGSDLGRFRGVLNNINDTSEIRYDFTADGAQTIFFYINNTPVRLRQQANAPVTNFELATDEDEKAFSALFSGENEIKFIYQGSKNSYEKTIKIYLIPTNTPVIPVEGTKIYPYSSQLAQPLPNDPKFVERGGLYTTTESIMNIYGTFDFLDFPTFVGNDDNIVNGIIDTIKGMHDSSELTKPSQYILKIESSNGPTTMKWDLTQDLIIMDGDRALRPTGVMQGATPNIGLGDLAVRYDIKTKTFSFILREQNLNPNGSSSVYSFTVYNNGETGPRATYRLEVDPTAMSYKIIRPELPKQAIVNQNFIEVLIDSPGAQSITINKQSGEKIDYVPANPAITDSYDNTFRVIVNKLKVGKNKIDFTIQGANDSTTGSFEVTYAPTNIPGAQVMETMASNHKVFDNALNLKFEKGTTLIRSDYNVPELLKNQVYTGHNLLFAIANPEDGVVNRYSTSEMPPNFNITLESLGTRFRLSYPSRFTKASPVYWIDAGMADDPATTASYDPLTMGVDPYQFPNTKGTNGTAIPTYDDRPDNRELVTSKTGTLTLGFDPNMKDSIGTVITVYRYDVKTKSWENIGGTVDVKKNTVTVPFNKFGYYVVGKMVYSFTDMTSHPYARNFLEAVYAKGIMNAAGFDDFGANMYVSRGEFARMLVKALDMPLNYELSKLHFDDVPAIAIPEALWDYRYIETAAREGIIRGTGSRTFEPANNLTRQEAAVIITRALDLKLETDADKINNDLEKQFKDAANVSYYAKNAVLAIAKKSYIKGSPVDSNDPKAGMVFEPQSNLLRSDAAIIIARILTDMKKLPAIR